MLKEYVGLKFTIIDCGEQDVLTESLEVTFEDGVGVSGNKLWTE